MFSKFALGFGAIAAFLVVLVGAMASFPSIASASMLATSYSGPALRLPWLSGSYNISGNTYNCGDHGGPVHPGLNSPYTWDQFAIDFGLPAGTQVTAVFAGTVHIGAPDPKGYGNNLWVTNGNYRAVYAHLSSIQVTEGQSVVQGQVLGLSGYSGNVSPQGPAGAHLHFSLRYGGTGRYDGSPVVPEPMSGYTGFGNVNSCVPNPNTRYTPGPVTSGGGATTVNYTVSLTGIGTNTSAGQNNHPLHPTRPVAIQVRNGSNQNIFTTNSTITYNSSTGLYYGSVKFSLPAGSYLFLVKVSNGLNAQASNIFQSGGTVTEPTISPVIGDANGDNAISILDYNIVGSCYGKSATGGCANADFNDNGTVDLVDYNTVLKALSNHH